MADKVYDAVVVGGGHHGLIIACYLQKSGMRTAVFELHQHVGGSVFSTEGPLPGFVMNPCANWTRFYGHPAYEEFHLREKGLEYIFPEENEAMIFDDDTCFVGYSAFKVVDPITGKTELSHENVKKTLNEIRRFSKQDSETAEELLRRYVVKWKKAMAEYRFSPPIPWGTENSLEKLCHDEKDGFDPIWQFMTVRQLAYDIFESEELRTLFMRAATTSLGASPDDVIGLPGLVHVLALVLSWEPAAIAKGGVQRITDSLLRAFLELGGEVFTGLGVKKILVEGGRASGIRLADGSEVEAKQLVVSDLSALQTISLVGEEHFDKKVVNRVRNIRYDRHNIVWAVYILKELPVYKAAAFNPDCGKAPRTYLGPKNADYMATKYFPELFLKGISSKLFMFLGIDTIWDRSRVAGEYHIAGIEEFSAPARLFRPEEWQSLRLRFEREIVAQWRIYAPNMTEENIVAARVYTPHDIMLAHPNMHEGSISCGDMIISQLDRFRPTPELAGYRMPIKSLYICSSAAHNGNGTGRGCSYNCWQVIKKDYGL